MIFSKPPILRREQTLLRVGFLMGALQAPAAAIFFLGGGAALGLPRAIGISLFAVAVVCSMGAMLASIILVRRKLTRIKANQFLICGCCGQDLRGLPSGPCPECGIHTDMDELQSFWMRYIRAYLNYGQELRAPAPRWLNRLGLKWVGAMAVVWLVLLLGVAVVASQHFSTIAIPLILLLGWLFPLSLHVCSEALERHVCARLIRESGLICTGCGAHLLPNTVPSTVPNNEQLACTKCALRFQADDLARTWKVWRPPCWDLEKIQVPNRANIVETS